METATLKKAFRLVEEIGGSSDQVKILHGKLVGETAVYDTDDERDPSCYGHATFPSDENRWEEWVNKMRRAILFED
jgi:hypothetical protein